MLRMKTSRYILFFIDQKFLRKKKLSDHRQTDKEQAINFNVIKTLFLFCINCFPVVTPFSNIFDMSLEKSCIKSTLNPIMLKLVRVVTFIVGMLRSNLLSFYSDRYSMNFWMIKNQKKLVLHKKEIENQLCMCRITKRLINDKWSPPYSRIRVNFMSLNRFYFQFIFVQ